MANSILEKIYTFPIKGFPGIELSSTGLTSGKGITGDRHYAVTRGVSPTGDWMPARSYYINARTDGMLKFKLDQSESGTIKITNPAGKSVTIEPDNSASLEGANLVLPQFMEHAGVADDLPPPQIIERGAKGNWDYPDTPISIINGETVRVISSAMGKEMDPLRYRGNLILDGFPAWEEFALMGKRIRIGGAEFEVMRPIARCPTPGVDPKTGDRDIPFESLMPEQFGHSYCGMYAVVTRSGAISVLDEIEVLGNCKMSFETASREAEDYRLWPRIVEISNCEIRDDITRMSLAGTGPWPLPEAKPGQRIRFLLGANNWTSEYIAGTTSGHYHFEIEKSATADPVSEHLRTAFSAGDRLVVCGPFGRV